MATVAIVTDVGLKAITALQAASDVKHVGFGTGTTGAVVGDTELETARSEARTSGTQTQETTNTTDDTYQVVANIICTATTAAITEVGLFDAATDGIMSLRSTFDVINLEVGDGVEFTIQVVLNQA